MHVNYPALKDEAFRLGLVKCVEYPNSKRKIDIMMINNKYVNSELRNALYRTTNDINYISPIAKDIFVF